MLALGFKSQNCDHALQVADSYYKDQMINA